MSTPIDPLDPSALLADNLLLRERVRTLEERLIYLSQHKSLAAGIAGERLAAKLTSGTTTSHVTPHDIVVGNTLIEVKYSNLSRPNKTAPTLRWQWNKIFGQTGQKEYHFLLLIGEADERFRSIYLDSDSPYIFFLIPTVKVIDLCTKGSPLSINLSSNPQKAKGLSAQLFEFWQVNAAHIEQKFGI